MAVDHVYEKHSDIPFKTTGYLGNGASGLVEKVERVSSDSKPTQVYARKAVIFPKNRQECRVQDFLREASIAKSVKHIHAVRVVETYQYDRSYAIIMEPVAEGDLGDFLNDLDHINNRGNLDRIPQWFGCLAGGLAYLHARSIHHRDIKPQNILCLGRNILFTDFGISREFKDMTLAGLTGTQGTINYRAPELDEEKRGGRKADVFSLGAVFLEMLTVYLRPGALGELRSRRPYSKQIDKINLWINSLESKPLDIDWYLTMLFLCRNMLQKDKDKRPYIEGLTACWNYQPILATPPTSCECISGSADFAHLGTQGRNDALQKASMNGHLEVVMLLLEKGADLAVQNKHGRTPLLLAALNGHEAVVKLLVSKDGVELNSKDNAGRTPLLLAALNGHEAVVKLLIAKDGVELYSKDNYGEAPLSLAARDGHEAVVKLLLETSKAEVDWEDAYDGQTPLSWAARNGHEAVVKLLLNMGKVNVDSEDLGGQTPLSWAAENGYEAVVKLLLDTGKVRVDFKGWRKHTPLLVAALNGHEAVVKLLLDTGKVRVDFKGWRRHTPLSGAALNGHEAVVKLLLDTGKVRIDFRGRHGRTPLSWAVEKGHEAVVKLLIDTGKVNVNSKDSDGRALLSWAAEKGHEGVVKLLLDTGKVDVDWKEPGGRTPLSWATRNGHQAVVNLLQSHSSIS